MAHAEEGLKGREEKQRDEECNLNILAMPIKLSNKVNQSNLQNIIYFNIYLNLKIQANKNLIHHKSLVSMLFVVQC